MTRLESQEVALLQKLTEMQKTQIRGFTEMVPDVPRMRLKRDKVYTFTRTTATGTQLLNSTTVPITYASAVSLSILPNAAEFTNLFEQYRIIQATWLFTPLYSAVVANPLYTWFDPDDDSLPTGTAQAAQSQTLRITQSAAFAERTYIPQPAQGSVSNGTLTPGFSAVPSMIWMDNDSSSNKYFGLKALIPANTNISANVPLYSVEISVVLQCRRPF